MARKKRPLQDDEGLTDESGLLPLRPEDLDENGNPLDGNQKAVDKLLADPGEEFSFEPADERRILRLCRRLRAFGPDPLAVLTGFLKAQKGQLDPASKRELVLMLKDPKTSLEKSVARLFRESNRAGLGRWSITFLIQGKPVDWKEVTKTFPGSGSGERRGFRVTERVNFYNRRLKQLCRENEPRAAKRQALDETAERFGCKRTTASRSITRRLRGTPGR